jgi:hypothetical protein
MCGAVGHVRSAPDSDRESEFPQKVSPLYPESEHSQGDRQSERCPDLPKVL